MKKNRRFVSTFVLVAISAVSCAQNPSRKDANSSATVEPQLQLRWKYETGG